MREFPKALYRAGAGVLVDGAESAFLVVQSEAEQAQALVEGWAFSAGALPAEDPADDAPPSRAELEAKATDLGIKWDGRWGDKRLSDAIAAKV